VWLYHQAGEKIGCACVDKDGPEEMISKGVVSSTIAWKASFNEK